MKRILTLFAIFCFSFAAKSQVDLSVIAITSPTSGCALTATENVTIRIFNYGSTLIAGTSFNVTYTINAGPPVTELVTLGSNLLTNSTMNYTFTTQANLSAPGVYTFDATVSIVGDVNASNDAFTGYVVTNTANSVGGTISGGTNVCISGNAGVLTLSGHTGNVLNWEYSTDGGTTWFNISNTTTTQAYNNLTVPTDYRAVVQNGGCASATSTIASMTIDPATVGGTLAGSATRCSGSNSGNITLSGYVGSVVRWEYSIDGGVTWTNIANTTTTQSYLNLTTTTIYRARVQSGSCGALYSTNATITINPTTVGGTINPAVSNVCSGSNSGTLTLSGQTGAIIRWEYSTDGGVTWINIVNNTTTQNYLNLTVSRLYRARVQSSPCAVQYSAVAAVNVGAGSTGGTISSSATVCSGSNSGTLTLSGETGSIIQWEYSTDGGVTWNIIANTTNTENYLNLTQTTAYRVLVQNGGCPTAYSSIATITVNPVSVGGTVSGSDTVCSGSNSGSLTVSGYTGTIIGWESSNDSIIWTATGNTTATQTYTNLTDTTYYRVIVQSGVCPSDTSIVDSIIVDPVTVGGTISPATDTVCSGANSGILTIVGGVGGVLQWEYSTDGGVTWITIINTTATQAYNNLTTPTIYRALLQSGVCSQQYSAQTVISIDAQPVGGTLYSDVTVCGGSNSGTLTLVGHVGNISNWESSTDGGITWSNIANTTYQENYLNVAITTMYRVIVASGVCPLDTSNVITISVDAPSVGGLVSASDTVCASANGDTLTLSGQTGNVTGWEYSQDGGVTWVNLANTSTSQAYLNLATTTMYRVRVANGVCPSTTSDTVTVTVDPAAVAGTISGSTSVCEGTGSGTLTLSGTTGSVVDWEWSTDGGLTWNAIGNSSMSQGWSNPADTTWYRAIVASGGCANDTSASAVITTYPRPVASFTLDTVCLGTPTTFVNTTTISSGGIQLTTWSFGDNNNSVSTSPTYEYVTADTFGVVMISISNLGCSDTAVAGAIVHPLPDASITLGGMATVCSGDSVQLSVPSFPQNWYDWNNGDSTSTIFADTTWNYVVQVTDSVTGCMALDSVLITILPRPIANAGPDTSVSAGSSVVLQGSGGTMWNWIPTVALDDPTSATPTCTPVYTVTYTLTVTDANGCSDTDAVVVTLDKDLTLIISNVITANGDGYNDVWNVQNIEFYPNNHVTIYNRNGMEVYEAEGYNNSWDGTYNGELLPDGTYYYVLEFPDEDVSYSGAVTIVSEKK